MATKKTKTAPRPKDVAQELRAQIKSTRTMLDQLDRDLDTLDGMKPKKVTPAKLTWFEKLKLRLSGKA